ncbi:hypothetical protein RIdsm_01608 [Roseovarius indicus]|uniref:Uncharacterized protein n=2 Tax=Roseovarius indicus TaxID=540747 RepID=A0A5P3A8Y8_9RHOB|nr:hypothetical protein RIdsm_01608 [Roseovarius indicus]SFD88859.1 hypothetical protein SAMN04488031_10322 [Roseovarius indicus]
MAPIKNVDSNRLPCYLYYTSFKVGNLTYLIIKTKLLEKDLSTVMESKIFESREQDHHFSSKTSDVVTTETAIANTSGQAPRAMGTGFSTCPAKTGKYC